MKNNITDNDPIRVAQYMRFKYEIGIESPVNFDRLLQVLNIKVIYEDLGSEYLGCSDTKGLKKIIIINEQLKEQCARERFTIGHEIGHIVLHHGKRLCNKYDFNELKSTNQKENEANLFSSELLLPQKVVMEYLKKKDITFKLITQISRKYSCSLTSTAIKLVKLSNDPVAVFLHKSGKIKWSIASSNFKGVPISGEIGYSAKVNQLKDSEIFIEGYVDNDTWFTDLSDDDKCYEETFYFSNLKQYLTIVRIEESC